MRTREDIEQDLELFRGCRERHDKAVKELERQLAAWRKTQKGKGSQGSPERRED